jgi:tripartite-type tricarboxylate transporter receptor subunit TctC
MNLNHEVPCHDQNKITETYKMVRFKHIATSLLALGAIASAPAHAEFPEKPINLIVPFNAGGGTDILIRGFAPEMAKALKGNVFVSNMAGGSGTVAASALAQQKPDGYQLGYWSVTVSTVQPQIKDVPYNVDSWTPICAIGASPAMFFVKEDSPFKTLKEVETAVKASPGKYVYGSSGPGAMTHLAMVAAFSGMNAMKDVKHLPFQGSGPAMQAMAAGTIQFFGDTETLMKKGGLRPLGVFNDKRLADLPNVPTMAELGIKKPLNELYLWGGLFAPAKLDKAIQTKLSNACKVASESAGFKSFADKTGTVVRYMDAQAFDSFYRAEYKNNIELIKAAGLK